jgi:3-oxoacyl-[acyl-carrier-protein] synthase-3
MLSTPDIGIGAIACEIPAAGLDNLARAAGLNASESLIRGKIGVLRVARKQVGQETSDLGEAAVRKLFERGAVRPEEVDCLVVVTQNPDQHGLPNVSSILHGRLGLAPNCACFDLSLGCSGFVYSLAVVSSFMKMHGLRRGLLVTADPYSKIVSDSDRNTSLLFGDGAAATLLTDEPVWRLGQFDFGSDGTRCGEIAVREKNGPLHMNGRGVLEFCLRIVPQSIQKCLQRNGLELGEIDRLLLHQGSRHIVSRIGECVGVAPERTPFLSENYGNTVSSSIPIMLASDAVSTDQRVLISGFGVGLSWATTVLQRI